MWNNFLEMMKALLRPQLCVCLVIAKEATRLVEKVHEYVRPSCGTTSCI